MWAGHAAWGKEASSIKTAIEGDPIIERLFEITRLRWGKYYIRGMTIK